MVDRIDLRIVSVSIANHSGFAVIGHEDLSYTPEVFKHMAATGVLLFIDENFYIRLLVVAHASDE